MKNQFLLIFIAIIYTSCRKEVKLKLPDIESKPVVYCYISPSDTVIHARITKSSPLFKPFDEKAFESQKNATITISNGIISERLQFDNASMSYTLSTDIFPVLHGKAYSLKAKLADGSYVEAFTNIPAKTPDIKSYRMVSQTVNTTTILNIYLKFLDDANEQNNYCLFVNQLDTFGLDTIRRSIEYREFLTDKGYEGKEGEIKIGLFDQVSVLRSPGFDCYLISCSKDYYQFKSMINYYSGSSPFSEPTPVYSNIIGGYGVFAGYSMSKVTIYK